MVYKSGSVQTVQKMIMRRVCVCAMMIIALASVSHGYTWRRTVPAGVKPEQFSSEYDKLLGAFPEHRNIINRLYSKYSGWIIPIAGYCGIAPLIALNSVKNIDEAFPIMYVYSDEFMDIYNSLRYDSFTEKVRAEISLELLLAFSITDEEQHTNFQKELKSLIERDKEISRQGAEANYYARQIVSSKFMPRNLLHELKQDNPNEYQVLLQKISRADYETLKACAEYPNAIAFLLNTGKNGIGLIERTEGQVITLSWFLDADHQKQLSEQFRIYPRLSEAIKYCGADAYFTIMACPDLFFQLLALLQGDISARYSMAYAVMLCQAGENNEGVKFLQGLSKSECQRLAYYAAELMNLPDEERYFGNSLAPIREPLFLQFTERYGELAVEACKNFSAVVDVSNLLMKEWDGDNQDITPVLRALVDYRDAGLQAAIFFSGLKDVQTMIVNYPNAFDRETLLMFMFYDETSNHHYTPRIGNRDESGRYMLANYSPAKDTGLPAKSASDNGWTEYIPFYDSGVVLKNWWCYGKVPSAIEVFNVVNDAATLIPFVAATYGLVAKSSGKMIISNARKAIVKAVTSPLNTAKNTMNRIIKSAKTLTLGEMKDELLSVFKSTGKRSVEAAAELSLPSWDNFRDFAGFIMNKQLDQIPIVNILRYPDKVRKLYSKPWLTKRATEFLVNKTSDTVEGIAKEKIMNHAGMRAIIDQLVK